MLARPVEDGTDVDTACAVVTSLELLVLFSPVESLLEGAVSGAIIWIPETVAVGTAGSNDAGWALRADARCASRYNSSMDFRGGR